MKAFDVLVNIFFPPRCVTCNELLPYYSDSLFCDDCYDALDEELLQKCDNCGKTVSECRCMPDILRPSLESLVSVSRYTSSGSKTDKIVLFAKDFKNKKLFDFMADKMIASLYASLPAIGDLTVTFVPRSAKRKRETGHDQSEMISRAIADKLSVKFDKIFQKRGEKQQKKLDKHARADNARSSYQIIKGREADVKGKIFLLCDDVVTTGASLSVCAELLLKAGAHKVYGVSFAKTVKRRKVKRSRKSGNKKSYFLKKRLDKDKLL